MIIGISLPYFNFCRYVYRFAICLKLCEKLITVSQYCIKIFFFDTNKIAITDYRYYKTTRLIVSEILHPSKTYTNFYNLCHDKKILPKDTCVSVCVLNFCSLL